MSCKPGVHVSPPPLPGPYTIPPVPPAPTVTDPDLCCQLPALPIPVDFIQLPPGTLDVAVPFLQAALDTVLGFIDGLPLDCPRE